MPHPLNASRLVNILERMSSPHDGEAANAARMAHEMVRKADLTWADVIGISGRPKAAAAHAVDAPIQCGDQLLHPPHERSWVASTLFLIRQATGLSSRMSEADRSWLLRQAAMWRTRAIKPYEAARLVEIYDRLSGPAEAS